MVSGTDHKIREMIGRALKKDPDISNAELQKKAKRIDKGVSQLSPRAFNARYPLQVKRKLSPKKSGRKRGSGKKTVGKKRSGASAASRAFHSWATTAFRGKKKELVSAVDSAFDEVMRSDTVSSVDKLLSKMDKAKKVF